MVSLLMFKLHLVGLNSVLLHEAWIQNLVKAGANEFKKEPPPLLSSVKKYVTYLFHH